MIGVGSLSFSALIAPPLLGALVGVAILLALFPLALLTFRFRASNALVYLLSLVASGILLGAGATHLLRGDAPEAMTLPLGLPWVGAHFRLDALSAAFLVIVNLGAAAASVFALGYGAHERARGRVLPFFPL